MAEASLQVCPSEDVLPRPVWLVGAGGKRVVNLEELVD